MLDLGSADAVGQCAKCAVRGSVRVAADHGHAGQGGTVFWANDVHDTLALGQEGEEGCRAVFLHVRIQRGDLLFADRVGDAVVAQLPAGGGGVVVGGGHDGADTPDFAACLTQPFKGLGAGDFVHQVAVDVQDGGAVFFGVDDVFVPDFVVEGACHGASLLCSRTFYADTPRVSSHK